MTSGDTSISKLGKRKLRRGCLWTLIVLCAGVYVGNAATKRALSAPNWVRSIAFYGATLPTAPPPAASPVTAPQAQPNQPAQPPVAPGGQQSTGTQGPPAPNSGGQQPQVQPPSGQSSRGSAIQQPAPQTPPEGGWLVGAWEITDELHPTGSQAYSATTQYVFDEGGTGEFRTNGKKLYDLHWEDANDYLLVTYVMDAEGGDNTKVKLKYSITPDHNNLTLTSDGKKDMRQQLYPVGPGVFHRVKQTS